MSGIINKVYSTPACANYKTGYALLSVPKQLLAIRITLSHYDITIKTFIKILLCNARDHDQLEGTKQHKFTENRSKNRINSRREVEEFPNFQLFTTYEHT